MINVLKTYVALACWITALGVGFFALGTAIQGANVLLSVAIVVALAWPVFGAGVVVLNSCHFAPARWTA